MLQDIIKKDSTDRSVRVLVVDSTTGIPETGVAFDTPGIALWWRRELEAANTIAPADLLVLSQAHTDGGFKHISDGVCRLDLPDAAFATGARYVEFGGSFAGMVVVPGVVKLVDYDPDDAAALGLSRLDVNISTRSSHAAPDLSNLDVAVSTRLAAASYLAPDNATIAAIAVAVAALNDPTAAAISALIASALATAHGAGSWETGLGGGAGAKLVEFIIKDNLGATIADAEVWITRTTSPSADLATGSVETDGNGKVEFMLDPGVYYRWVQKTGKTFTDNPFQFTVTA